MPIDWFTAAAQAINFLILVGLLRRFLYGPILRGIDAREKLIAGRLADAAAKEAEALKQRDEFQRKNADFERDKAARLKAEAADVQAQRAKLLDQARKDADALRAARQAALQNEAQNLDMEIAHRTQKEVFAIVRKTLAELADSSLEERMTTAFMARLRALPAPAKAAFAAELKAGDHLARLRSAFELPPAQRSAIENAVREIAGSEAHLQFEAATDLVAGIELSSRGQKVAWSIADSLASLQKSAAELLQADAVPKPKAKP